jgi:uncharacterized membrane protein YphA (DoxX/SURF4 family)
VKSVQTPGIPWILGHISRVGKSSCKVDLEKESDFVENSIWICQINFFRDLAMRRTAIFLGRFFIGSLFVFSGLCKVFDWQKAEQTFLSILGDWHSLSFHFLQNFFTSLVPWATAIVTVVCAVEILGGVLLILGVKARLFASLLLIVFLPMTILLYPFWFFDGSKQEMLLTLFMKNVAILGSLIYVILYGAKETFVSSDFEA